MSLLSDLLGDITKGLIPSEITDLYKKALTQVSAPDINFKPFTVSGPSGKTITDASGNTSYELNPTQQLMADNLFRGATGFYNQAMVGPGEREAEIYNRMRSAQRPEEIRNRMELEERLLSQGRSGIRTNQYGGSPEELAMAKYQAERNDMAMLTAMQQGQAEQMQQATLGSQYLQQSYAPQASLLNSFAPALDVASMADVARRQQGEFNLEADLANLQGELGQQTGLAQLYGSVYGGLLGGLGGIFTANASDKPWWM